LLSIHLSVPGQFSPPFLVPWFYHIYPSFSALTFISILPSNPSYLLLFFSVLSTWYKITANGS
jgi:hypothetical protein